LYTFHRPRRCPEFQEEEEEEEDEDEDEEMSTKPLVEGFTSVD
jgi:hypothetical protein